MIELINELPNNVVGFKATGQVSKADYENVVVPAVDALAESTGKINFLLELDTDISNYTSGAAFDDMMVGFKHFTQWNKIAIVSDQKGVEKVTNALDAVVPGKAKGFPKSKIDEAKSWVIS